MRLRVIVVVVVAIALFVEGGNEKDEQPSWLLNNMSMTAESARDQFIKHEYQRAILDTKCSTTTDDIKVTVIYFWPGDWIKLNCTTCTRGLHINGRDWNWALARSTVSFLNKLRLNVKDTSTWQYLFKHSPPAQPSFYGEDRMPRLRQQDGRYVQRGPFLHIPAAPPSASGLYFCHALDAPLETVRQVYVVLAMVPVNGVTQSYKRTWINGVAKEIMPQLLADCGNTNTRDTAMPDDFWRMRFQPAVYRDGNECWYEGTDCFAEQNDHGNGEWRIDVRSCGEENCNLEIHFKWDDWTANCEQGAPQITREGHCYLRRKDPGKPVVRSSIELMTWLDGLRPMLETSGEFSELGVRLHSSAINSVTMSDGGFSGEYESCRHTSSPGAEKYETRWRRLLVDFGVSDNGVDIAVDDTHNRSTLSMLENCLHFRHHTQGDDFYEEFWGTYAIQVQDCF